MTYDTASAILARHFVESRPSNLPGHIAALSEFVRDGVVGFEWEDVEMNVTALRNWLGY